MPSVNRLGLPRTYRTGTMGDRSGDGWMRESLRYVVLVLGLAVAACGSSSESSSPTETSSGMQSDDAKPTITEDEAHDRAVEAVADQTFEEAGDASTCTDDCGGHDAGFEWAKENGVTDSSECDGKSQSFIEGCEAYAQAVDQKSEEVREGEGEET